MTITEEKESTPDIEQMMVSIGRSARKAAAELATVSEAARNQALQAAANAIREQASKIIEANKIDMQSATERGLSAAMLDRLGLDDERIEGMAVGIESIIELPDPVGRVLAEWERPNGLRIQRVSVPLGVIGIIYESRPNVTSDAAGLCLKSGNAVILRGGSESFNSSSAIFSCMQSGLRAAGIDPSAVQMIPTTDRAAVGYLLSSMSEYLDVVVPRGGKSLIQRVQQEARVPVIGHLEGLCHVYLHKSADVEMATAVTLNAKMRRTGICGAAETLLVDREAAETLLPPVCGALMEAGCEIRGDDTTVSLIKGAIPANDDDWSEEYLDAIISVRVVDDIDAALAHIRQYGSGHTESIVASDQSAAERFLQELDSAILLHNASTQYADGGEFGMGAEIGIATGRVHARGPVGAEQLTSYKYVVRGDGQVRP
jgi:glutamate-5-semialdehyde dehydrogenase